MNFKEILWGTLQEVQADRRYAQLLGKQKLSRAEQRESNEVRGLSKRLFYKRAITVIGGVAVTASFGTALWAILYNKEGLTEESFFDDITKLSLDDQVRSVDDYYSQSRLSLDAARSKVLPIWVRNYVEKSQSTLTVGEILKNIVLFTDENTKADQTGIELGRVQTKPPERYIGSVQINFSTFPSNQPTRHRTEGSIAPGIVFLRSGTTHELSHFDTIFRDDPEFGKIINDNSVFSQPIPNADQLIVNGFGFVTVAPDKSYAVYFADFDELATDVVTSYILDKGKHKMVFAYNKAAILRKFLDWISFPEDDFIAYHRTSDLKSFAREFGVRSGVFTKSPARSEIEAVVVGAKAIRVFQNAPQPQEMENFFPGFMRNVMDAPPLLIR